MGMLAARPASRKCTGCDRNPEVCWDRKTGCGQSTGTMPCSEGRLEVRSATDKVQYENGVSMVSDCSCTTENVQDRRVELGS